MKIPEAFLADEHKAAENLEPVADYITTRHQLPPWFTDRCIDTAEALATHQDVFVDFDHYPVSDGGVHFRMYQLVASLDQAGYFGWEHLPERAGEFFDMVVGRDWGLLCLLCNNARLPDLRNDPQRRNAFFSALVRHWEEITAVPRTFGCSMEKRPEGPFWLVQFNNLFPLMRDCGIPARHFHRKSPGKLSAANAVELINRHCILN